MLKSLLVDGKIDEANAKTYLETVFGCDEGVSSYLESLNLTQQHKSIGSDKRMAVVGVYPQKPNWNLQLLSNTIT